MGSPKRGAIGERAARVDFTAKKASSASLERGSSPGSKIGRTQLNLFLNGLTEDEARKWSEKREELLQAKVIVNSSI